MMQISHSKNAGVTSLYGYRGLHLLGCVQHMLCNLIADIDTFGDVSHMADQTCMEVVVDQFHRCGQP